MNAPEDQNGLREALAGVFYKIRSGFIEAAGRQTGAFENQDCAWWWDADDMIAGPLASLIADRASLRAAEAEITRLKEGMEAQPDLREQIAAFLEDRAAYFDRTAGHWDRTDTARSYRATAQDIRGIRVPGIRVRRRATATLSPKEHPHG